MTSSRLSHALLDRDGTIIAERVYLSDPTGVELLPGAAEGIRSLREVGLGVAVVSNQSGVGRGLFTAADVDAINARMAFLLAGEGASVDAVYVCPHTPAEGCGCRKPRPGLLARAARDLGFAPDESLVVGDKPCDIALGAAAGARTVLVRTGYGRKTEREGSVAPEFVIDDLGDIGSVLAEIAEDAPEVVT